MNEEETKKLEEIYSKGDPFYDIFTKIVKTALQDGNKVTLVQVDEGIERKYTANIRPDGINETFAIMYGIRATIFGFKDVSEIEKIARDITPNYNLKGLICELSL